MKKWARLTTIGLLLSTLVIPAAWADSTKGEHAANEKGLPELTVPISDNASPSYTGDEPVVGAPDHDFDWKKALEEDGVSYIVEPVTNTINQVMLQMEPQPSAGYAIKVTRIEFVDNTAYIYYRITRPEEGSFNATVITEPFAVTFVSSDYDIVIYGEPEAVPEPVLPEDQIPAETDEIDIAPAVSTYEGTIANLEYPEEGSASAWLARLELRADEDEPYDRILFYINKDTQIVKTVNGELVPASIDDLKDGQSIQVEASGPALMSYPMQIGADKVIIQK